MAKIEYSKWLDIYIYRKKIKKLTEDQPIKYFNSKERKLFSYTLIF